MPKKIEDIIANFTPTTPEEKLLATVFNLVKITKDQAREIQDLQQRVNQLEKASRTD